MVYTKCQMVELRDKSGKNTDFVEPTTKLTPRTKNLSSKIRSDPGLGLFDYLFSISNVKLRVAKYVPARGRVEGGLITTYEFLKLDTYFLNLTS